MAHGARPMAQDGMSHWLEGLSDEQLTSLVEVRLGPVARLPTSFDHLASVLSAPQACGEALRQLDRTAVQVVAVLAESGARLGVDVLAGRMGADPALVTGALERASGLALAWPVADAQVWRTPGGLLHLAGPVLRRGLPYADLLPELGLRALRALMGTHGLGGARATWDAVDVLARELPGRVPGLLSGGPADLADGLRGLLLGHGPSDPLVWAEEQGLLLSIGEGWFVPAEVERWLRGDRVVLAVEEPPARVEVAPVAAPVTAVLSLLGRAHDLLDALEATPPRALAAGGLGVKELRRLAKVVGRELDEVVLLLQLLATAGLVATGARAGALTGTGRHWRRLPEEQAYARLVSRQLHPRAVLEPSASSPSGVLQAVARSGYGLPSVRDVAVATAARGPESDASLTAWLDWSQWRRGDQAVRVAAFAQPLRVLELLGLRAHGTTAPWLAALLAVEQSGSLLETQDDEGLAAAAQAVAEHLPPAQDDVVLQADATAVVAGRADAGLRALLDQLGRRESDHTWRLSADGVRTALDAGRTGEDLLAELRRRSRHGVPAVVEQLVRDMAQAHGRIRVHAAKTVLQLADPVLGVELVHDRRLRALGLVEIAPGVLGSAAPPPQVVAALRDSGHAPTGEGAAPPGPPAAPAKRSSRPVVHPRPWGHPAAQVVAALRAGPARPAPPPPVTPGGRAALQPGLLARLAHLAAAERMLLVEAVRSGGPVELDYVDAAGEPTTRVVHGLEDTGHLLVGWCRLRQDERMFAPLGILAARPAR